MEQSKVDSVEASSAIVNGRTRVSDASGEKDRAGGSRVASPTGFQEMYSGENEVLNLTEMNSSVIDLSSAGMTVNVPLEESASIAEGVFGERFIRDQKRRWERAPPCRRSAWRRFLEARESWVEHSFIKRDTWEALLGRSAIVARGRVGLVFRQRQISLLRARRERILEVNQEQGTGS